MAAKSEAIDTVEREIVARVTAAKFRLRFDKVALRFVGGLKAALADAVPEGQTLVFTITAPIRLPKKTALALEGLARSCPPDAGRRETLHDNKVRARRLTGVPRHMPRALGFVHTVESDAGAILILAEALLLAPNGKD
ncbi:MAG TPA: hypothetical protein VGG79_15185 [Roseiarcus sp.]|jgi:hypothetical protein